MKQLTLRVEDQLAEALKSVAGRRGESVNAYASAVLAAAVDPDLEDEEIDRLRARLARRELLADPRAPVTNPPSPAAVARARAAAGRGRSLSELVREGRR
jgi:hypothetical protein